MQLQEFESSVGKYRKDFGIQVAQSNTLQQANTSKPSGVEAELEESLGDLEPLLTMIGQLSRVIR